MIEPPYFPIIYIRGYAGTQGEVEDTSATPYMGFNLGSTKIRQRYTREVKPHVFESPIIRLMKDHGYVDAYHEGQILPQGPIPSRSIWIFRYYDVTSKDLKTGERKEIEFHAKELGKFIAHVRDAVTDSEESQQKFRVYLVAHSMGGLICRCYLQNSKIPDLNGVLSEDGRIKGVDKLFTYATPHGGIEFRRGLGWAEGLRDFLDPNNAGNFGPDRMRDFLELKKETPLNSLNNRFPESRVFSLVGTDSRDYGAAGGMSKRAVGPLSDGLVQIQNASVKGTARAFVHRSHSGHYGIVNSESGYQNLRRFLFGNYRVAVEMINVRIQLPPALEDEKKKNPKIKIEASYHIETVFSMRGDPIELNRRTFDEESAIFATHEKLTKGKTKLFTAFLLSDARVNRSRESLGYALRLQIRVPEYEVEGTFFPDHYEGGLLFSDKLNVEFNPKAENIEESIRFGWDRKTPNRSSTSLQMERKEEGLVGTIPFGQSTRPGIQGNLRISVIPWNQKI